MYDKQTIKLYHADCEQVILREAIEGKTQIYGGIGQEPHLLVLPHSLQHRWQYRERRRASLCSLTSIFHVFLHKSLKVQLFTVLPRSVPSKAAVVVAKKLMKMYTNARGVKVEKKRRKNRVQENEKCCEAGEKESKLNY